jgi:hypothetical protein
MCRRVNLPPLELRAPSSTAISARSGCRIGCRRVAGTARRRARGQSASAPRRGNRPARPSATQNVESYIRPCAASCASLYHRATGQRPGSDAQCCFGLARAGPACCRSLRHGNQAPRTTSRVDGWPSRNGSLRGKNYDTPAST